MIFRGTSRIHCSRILACSAIAVGLLAGGCSPESSEKASTESWKPLFDGRSLENWEEAKFSQAGKVRLEDKAIFLYPGAPFTGVVYTGQGFPDLNYEIGLEATLLEGNDFFCALTLPYEDTHFTFVAGGWSGSVTGISNIDDSDASENETRSTIAFEQNKPYTIKVRVTEDRIEAWIDGSQVVDLEVRGRKISLRPGEIGRCRPVGICSYFTKARIRKIRYRRVRP